MNSRLLLDADMQTIGRLLLQGWRWWVDELRSLVPAQLQRPKSSNGLLLTLEEGELVPIKRPSTSRGSVQPRPGMRAVILVPNELCLSRVITRPRLSESDLKRMVTLEADTLLPIPAGSAVVAGRALRGTDDLGKIQIEIAGLPLEEARGIAVAIQAQGIVPIAVIRSATVSEQAPLDFVTSMRDAGLLSQRQSATPFLWALVGLLILLNVAAWIWRDQSRLARFEQIVSEQQPAVTIAQTIVRRGEQDRRLISRSLSLRRSQDPLRVMANVGSVLPVGAWLQRYVWDGASVRLVGYRPAKTDVATALRRSGHFTEVRTTSDETQAAIPAGEPFDVGAKVISQ